METVAFCEFDNHARAVLKKHWPEIPIHEDVRTLDGRQYRGSVDVVCGGFPCQDLSSAGSQEGFEGDRSSLYKQMLRIIGECLPRYAVFENVSGLLTGSDGQWFAKFLYDLAAFGYDAEWHCISAAYVGAVHHRDRVWIIAYPDNNGKGNIRKGGEACDEPRNSKKEEPKRDNLKHGFNRNFEAPISSNPSSIDDGPHNGIKARRQEQEPGESDGRSKVPSNSSGQYSKRGGKIAHHLKQQIESRRSSEDFRNGFNLTEPALRRTDDGVSRRMDRLRLARLGNAVVPQIPEMIGRAIMDIET